MCNITAVAPVLVAEFDWIEKNQVIFGGLPRPIPLYGTVHIGFSIGNRAGSAEETPKIA